MSGVSAGFSKQYFVLEPKLIKWWDDEAHAVASQPPRGSMVLDQMSIMSNLKRARSGQTYAFRIDRHSLKGSGPRQKLVIAAASAEESHKWRKTLRSAGAADELQGDATALSSRGSARSDDEEDEQAEVANPVLQFLQHGKKLREC